MYKTIIVDDEKGCRDTLQSLLSKFPEINIVAQASSIVGAQEYIEALNPHLVFLDIEMPGGNGFDLLENINSITFDIIFTTAFDQYAIKAIKYSALDYLLKPIDPDELTASIQRFATKKHDQSIINNQFKTLLSNINEESIHHKIAVPDGEGINFIKVNNIIRFQSEGSYTYMHTSDQPKPILISKPMGDYQEMLSSANFVRVHRSHLINLNHVNKYIKGDGSYAVMSDGAKVEVSRRKRTEFSAALASF